MARTNVVVRKPSTGINTIQQIPVSVSASAGIGVLNRIATARRVPTGLAASALVGTVVPAVPGGVPMWSGPPTITFIQGQGFQTHGIAQYVSDSDTPDASLTITKNAIGLPPGCAYDQALQRFEYDGTSGANFTNGHVLTADDAQVNQAPIWEASVNQALTVGVPFTMDLDEYCADPESQPLTYTVLSGSLSAIGLAQTPLPGRGNIISGTPTTATGSPFAVTFRATD